LLGRWKNYDELEDCLTIEELLATIKSLREKDERDKKFNAAIQGIDLDEQDSTAPDITTLSGGRAQKAGFGIGMGLGYEVEGL